MKFFSFMKPPLAFPFGSWDWEDRLVTQGGQGPHPYSSSPVLLFYDFCFLSLIEV